MITALDIQNFKCYSRLRLPLGQLTLLTGFNGGGKSSAIQPLLLLTQSLVRSASQSVFTLNGPLVRLGTVADVLPADADRGIITFTVFGQESERSWSLATRAGERFLSSAALEHLGEHQPSDARTRGSDPDSGVLATLRKLVFLSAVRSGTDEAFPIPTAESERIADVGVDGRYAAYWYNKIVDEPVAERRHHPTEQATSVRKQLDAWLSTLFPGSQANVQALPQVSLLSLQFRQSPIGEWRRPVNVGYGLTYVFPILVALLGAEVGQTVIVDSPEAHLHPFAQSQMGRLLAHFAAAGVQVVVESHSDHLLNGVRLAVMEGTLSHEALRIHFFTGAQEEGHGVVSPSIDASGAINEWPEGFFDQNEKDLTRLTGWG